MLEETEMPAQEPSRAAWLRHVAGASAGLTLLMVALSSGFVVSFQKGPDVFSIVANVLTSISYPTPHTSFGVLALFTSTLTLGLVLLQLEPASGAARKIGWPGALVSGALAGLLVTLFWLGRAAQLLNIQSASARGDAAALVTVSDGLASILYLVVLALILVWAIALQPAAPRNAPRSPAPAWTGWVAAVGVVCLVIYLSIFFNLRPVQADVLMTQAKKESSAGRHDLALALFQQVAALMPGDAFYLMNAEKVYINAMLNRSGPQREQFFQAGLGYLTRAAEVEPLLVDTSMALARFYRFGGDLTEDPVQKNFRFFRANAYFASALETDPTRGDYWLAWAEFLALSGDLQGAYDKANTALSINPKDENAHAFLGDLTMADAAAQTDAPSKTILYVQALNQYQAEADLILARKGNPGIAYLAISKVYEVMGQSGKAAEYRLLAGSSK